jgi:hypothetical protein
MTVPASLLLGGVGVLVLLGASASLATWGSHATRHARRTQSTLDMLALHIPVLQAETMRMAQRLSAVQADVTALRLDHTAAVSAVLTELGRLREAVEQGKAVPVRTAGEQ